MMQARAQMRSGKTDVIKPTDETLYRKIEKIPFGPVYQSLHVYECLEIETFEKLFREQRRKQCASVTSKALFRQDNAEQGTITNLFKSQDTITN
eukprot:UN21240